VPGAELKIMQGMGHDLPHGEAWVHIAKDLIVHTKKVRAWALVCNHDCFQTCILYWLHLEIATHHHASVTDAYDRKSKPLQFRCALKLW